MEDSRVALIRRLALPSLAGQLVWVAVVVVAGAIEPGYSEVRDAISFLRARNVVGADALLLSVFAMAWRFRGDPRWGRADLLTVGAALLGLPIFALLFFVADDGLDGYYGLIQRLSLAAGAVWVAALALGLLAIHGRTGDPVVRLVERLRRLPGGNLLVQPGSGAGSTAQG